MSRFILLCFAVCLCTIHIMAQETAVIKAEVWKRDLSPAEQAALAEIEKTAHSFLTR